MQNRPAPTDRRSTRAGALTLPPDLLRKVRFRISVAALLFTIGFAVDPAILGVSALASKISGQAVGIPVNPPFLVLNLCAITCSVVLWFLTRADRLRQSTLLGACLVYEVVICGLLSVNTYREFLVRDGQVPHLTWVVPIIILLPLLVPTPPRTMLVTAIAAALTAPVGLYLVRLGEQFPVERVDYFIASMNPALAVLLAYLAAKVVYGLSVDIVRLRQMGSYELVEILGRGGMGEVWRARHRLLARPAAIKLIPTGHLHGGGPETPELALKRFEREAQATALLRSPHTVQVYDFGTADDGAFYYVMELLEGVDAETLVERFGPQPPARVIHLMRQACDSLAEAHEHGMVHRDIKPANLMVCHHGRRHDFVKVLDFGLVGKSPHFSQATDSQLSVDQMIGGTPAYMAPEQALGRELDGRADLYALGCVGYWLATGRTVFPSGTPIETITNHIHVPPVPPSARTEVPIPPDLDRIILDCLSKSPTGRPANADELAVRLGEVVISDPWTEERARTWWRTHLPNLAGSVDPTRAASW